MRPILLLVSILSFLHVHAQKEEYIWYFGFKAGLSFHTNPPTSLGNGKINSGEGCAVAANSSGNLLFYTDGVDVYNKNHVLMTNGSGLNGHASCAQSSIIVQNPDSQNIYYLFSTPGFGASPGLVYSVIDTSMSGGDGAVRNKNITLMPAKPTEHLSAVMHPNGKDVWVLTHRGGGALFYAYKITAAGVDTSPVISDVGLGMGVSDAGYIRFSHDGRKIAVTDMVSGIFGAMLFDFNPNTGEVSGAQQLSSGYGFYGVEFSESSRYLYLSRVTYPDYYIYQYDMWAGSFTDILNSVKTVFYSTDISKGPMAMQYAPDGRIYIASYTANDSISVINYPEKADTLCEVVQSAVSLNSNRVAWGLPNFVQGSFARTRVYQKYTCLGDSTSLSIRDSAMIDSVQWFFGDGRSSQKEPDLFRIRHRYDSAGLYHGKAVCYRGTYPYVYSSYFTVEILPRPFVRKSSDTTICQGDTAFLYASDTANPLTVLQWSIAGNTGNKLKVKPDSTKTYYVIADAGCGKNDSAAIRVYVRPPLGLQVSRDTTICKGDSVWLQAFGSGGDSSYLFIWNNSLGTGPEKLVKPGVTTQYTVSMTDLCTVISPAGKKITVNVRPPLLVKLGNDTMICAGDSIALFAQGSGGDSTYIFQWGNGLGPGIGKIVQPDSHTVYRVTISDQCTPDNDSAEIFVGVREKLSLVLSPDTILCRGQSILLRATGRGGDSSYVISWDQGVDTGSLKLSIPDSTHTYTAVLSDECSEIPDTAQVTVYVRPPLDISIFSDSTICNGAGLYLEPLLSGGDSSYDLTWDQGLGNGLTKTVSPDDTISYLLILTDGCTVKADSHLLTIKVRPAPMVNAGKDTLICAGSWILLEAEGFYGIKENYVFTWDQGLGGGQSHMIKPPFSGNYIVTLTDNCSKEAKDTVFVEIEDLPAAYFSVSDEDICLGGSIQFINGSSGPSDQYSYKWNFGDAKVSSDTHPLHRYSQAGDYNVTLILSSSKGCSDTLTEIGFIRVHPLPAANFKLKGKAPDFANPEIETDNLSAGAIFFSWTFGDQGFSTEVSPRHSYTDTGIYRISLIAGTNEGCFDTAFMDVRVSDVFRFYIPSAFTPNNDGYNDFFEFDGRGYRSVRTRIYNRWGELVFDNEKNGQYWDGKVGGAEEASDGVYFYRLDVRDFRHGMHVYTGTVTVMR